MKFGWWLGSLLTLALSIAPAFTTTTRAAAPADTPTSATQATAPQPRNNWIVVEGGKYQLSWKPAVEAQSQTLRFSKTREGLERTKGTALGTAGMARTLAATVATMELPVSNLKKGDTYYWRVDTVNQNGAPATTGETWSFRVVQKHLRIYLLGGQSNMTGEAMVAGLNEDQLTTQTNAIIFMRGQIDRSYHGTFGWNYVQPRLGSDARRFGPELGFTRAMEAAHPGEEIALIKCAFGGTNLDIQWRPPSSGALPGSAPTPLPTPTPNPAGRARRPGPPPGYLYQRWVQTYHDALAALDPNFEPEVIGMIWMQGEEDALHAEMAPHYEENLTNLIHDIRAEVKKPNLPFVLGEIADSPTYAPPKNFGPMVRAAQVAVSQKVPHTATFDTSDYKRTDPWHYDYNGQWSLGGRFAAAMIKLEKAK